MTRVLSLGSIFHSHICLYQHTRASSKVRLSPPPPFASLQFAVSMWICQNIEKGLGITILLSEQVTLFYPLTTFDLYFNVRHQLNNKISFSSFISKVINRLSICLSNVLAKKLCIFYTHNVCIVLLPYPACIFEIICFSKILFLV